MNRVLILGLATALVLAAGVAATGHEKPESEAHPDCEETSGPEKNQDNLAEGSPFVACEGEHWDGEDPTGTNQPDTGASFGGNGIGVAVNAGPDPAHNEPGLGTNAHHLRLSVGFLDTSAPVSVYYAQGQWGVGQQAFYADSDGTLAWYGKDGTDQPPGGVQNDLIEVLNEDASDGDADGNVIAWVVGYVGSPGGGFETGEDDCTQDEFDSSDCRRDNTAFTVHLLP